MVGKDYDGRLVRACALVLAIAVSWAAESYESDLNVARPAVLAVPPSLPPERHEGAGRLVWILVDGLRLDTSRKMPVLNRLRTEGLDVVARSEFPSYSGPNYIAQASGLEPAAAGVLSNGYPGELELDSVFRRAKLAGLRTAVVTTDNNDDLRESYASWIDESRLDDTLERLPSVDLLFVHIDDPDEAAHDYGTRSPEYRATVQHVDDFVERVVQTLDPTRDVLVLSSDHGNLTGGGHGGTEPEVLKIPIVVWGAGVAPGGRKVSRGRDVGPTIASLVGLGPLSHASGRPLVGGDETTVRQRAAVAGLVGAIGRRPTHHLPLTIVIAFGVFAALSRRFPNTTRSLATAPTYPLVFAGLLVATHLVSFSASNLTAPFAFRLTTLCALAGLAQLLAGGRVSIIPAAFATSLGVLAVGTAAAFQPLAPTHAMLRFLPIPALTSLAFVCLMTAAIGTPAPAGAPEDDAEWVLARPLRALRRGVGAALPEIDGIGDPRSRARDLVGGLQPGEQGYVE